MTQMALQASSNPPLPLAPLLFTLPKDVEMVLLAGWAHEEIKIVFKNEK